MSCNVPIGGRDNSLMKQVYRNQKFYYDVNISDKNNSVDQSILTFFNDISLLKEGVYKWDGTKWVPK